MIKAVSDTHALIWYLFGDPRIGKAARNTIHNAEISQHQIAVSSITLIEIVFLIERGKINPATLDRVESEMHRYDAWLIEIPLELRVARAMQTIERAQIPEMPDRIIAATALHLSVPVISRDGKIRTSNMTTIW